MPYITRHAEEFVTQSLQNNKILLLLGARQVGKTTLIKQLLKTTPGQLLNMDMEVDRARIKDAAQIDPHQGVKILTSGQILIIDEAHRVPDIGRITKGWYDADVPVKIILLGSSSAALVDMAASELVGRNEKVWLTPLLFEEVLSRQTWFSASRTPQELQSSFSKQIHPILMQRLVFGSYPESYLSNEPALYLENLTQDYLLKDIFTRSLVRSPEDVRRLLIELTKEIGQTVSIMQLSTRLRLSRQTVQRYLDLLEGISVIFKIPAFATNPATETSSALKYYFWDTGVKNALQRDWVVSSDRPDIELLWENWVIAEIMKLSRTYRRHEDLLFWRSRHDSNVELVVKQGSQLHPFNIAFHPHAAKPSRAFANQYQIEPKIIHPGNALEILL